MTERNARHWPAKQKGTEKTLERRIDAAMDSELGCPLCAYSGTTSQKAMPELRMALFQAEQRILDAQVQAEYYRSRLTFCESVLQNGIEQVSDSRRDPQPTAPASKLGPMLTTAKSA